MPETEGFAPRLPHRGPARLVERILARDATHVRAIARVPSRSPFRTQRSSASFVPAVLALEMAAQVTAAFDHADDGPREAHGFLVGMRDVRFHASELSADDDFVVEVLLCGESGGLREWSFSVRAAQELLAEGTLLTYLPAT